MSTLHWLCPTESGLCDRLIDVLFMVAYSRMKGHKNMVMDWPKFKAKDIDAPHRVKDILLENVLQHITFPHDVVFKSASQVDHVDENANWLLGAGVSFKDFHARFFPDRSFEEFMSVMESVANDFGFNAQITTFINGLPSDFVAIHIRRTDKVRTEPHDGNFIEEHELHHLDELTMEAIDFFASSGIRQIFICGDDDTKIQPFAERIDSHGLAILRCPRMEKWKSTYFDLAAMTRSRHNVTSQRHSSFSRFPSLIGRGRFSTVFSKVYKVNVPDTGMSSRDSYL